MVVLVTYTRRIANETFRNLGIKGLTFFTYCMRSDKYDMRQTSQAPYYESQTE